MKFDRRFFNFEDPEVFENMTGKDMVKHWRETYGIDFAAAENGNADSNTRNINDAFSMLQIPYKIIMFINLLKYASIVNSKL